MPDDLNHRFYGWQVERHRENAERALAALRDTFARLDLDNPVTATGAVRNAASDLAELSQALGALKALMEVESLVGEADG